MTSNAFVNYFKAFTHPVSVSGDRVHNAVNIGNSRLVTDMERSQMSFGAFHGSINATSTNSYVGQDGDAANRYIYCYDYSTNSIVWVTYFYGDIAGLWSLGNVVYLKVYEYDFPSKQDYFLYMFDAATGESLGVRDITSTPGWRILFSPGEIFHSYLQDNYSGDFVKLDGVADDVSFSVTTGPLHKSTDGTVSSSGGDSIRLGEPYAVVGTTMYMILRNLQSVAYVTDMYTNPVWYEAWPRRTHATVASSISSAYSDPSTFTRIVHDNGSDAKMSRYDFSYDVYGQCWWMVTPDGIIKLDIKLDVVWQAYFDFTTLSRFSGKLIDIDSLLFDDLGGCYLSFSVSNTYSPCTGSDWVDDNSDIAGIVHFDTNGAATYRYINPQTRTLLVADASKFVGLAFENKNATPARPF